MKPTPMEELNYESNSHRSREERTVTATEEKKVEKVVTGRARSKKKSKFHQVASKFIAEDARSVTEYVVEDVVIPAIKDTLFDIIKNGAEKLFFGSVSSRKKGSTASRISYREDYGRYSRDDRRPNEGSRSSSRFDYEDIIFESRGDAEAVLTQMDELIERYRVVSILDLYDMADLSAPPYTSDKYGWTSVRNADVQRVRDGYIIKLPRPMPID